MKRTLMLYGMTILSSFILLSCSKSSGDDGGDTGGSGGGGTPTGGTPGPLFTAAKSVVQANCGISGCHAGSNPQNGLNFSLDATIVGQKDRIKVRAVDNANTANQMPPPPSPALSAADQKRITDWVAAGGRLTD